jgi:hypothetical protein
MLETTINLRLLVTFLNDLTSMCKVLWCLVKHTGAVALAVQLVDVCIRSAEIAL